MIIWLAKMQPTWRSLLDTLIRRVSPAADRHELEELLGHGRYLEVATGLNDCHGPQIIAATIKEACQRPAAPRPSAYELVARLPVEHFLTTNYDPWLKDAVALAKATRQVNTLQLRVEPTLTAELSSLKRTLEERERDERSRLRHVLRRREGRR